MLRGRPKIKYPIVINDDSLEQEEICVQPPEPSNVIIPRGRPENLNPQYVKMNILDGQMK